MGMTSHPMPANESARLEALRQYRIMDTPREAIFDDIVLIASQMCDTPIATITLVDETRQWFKAQVGMTVCDGSSREDAFCAHTICSTGTMLVADAQKDPRFAANPLVTGAPHIRFYGGVPLRTQSGESLGSLCVIDCQPRQLTPGQTAALEALARQVMALLEARRVSTQLAGALEEVRVLEGLLPICGRCKKIQDRAGDWVGVETYVAQHSEADFTHGVCPHCMDAYRSSLAGLG